MKRIWLGVGGLFFVSIALVIAVRQAGWGNLDTDPGSDHATGSSRHLSHVEAEKEKTSGSRNSFERMSDEELSMEAIRLLIDLNESKDYARILLQYELSSLFREWGYRDIAAVERFLETEDTAQGSFDGMRLYHEDLILAAWIGYARLDPVDAWARFSKAWAEDERELIINPALIPLPHESAGYHLFKAYYGSDPASAVAWILNPDKKRRGLEGPALQVVMAAVRESKERQQLFVDLCVDNRAGYIDLAMVCAGVAEQDPEQAWEFIHWEREDTDGPLTSESPEIIASNMILHWSIRQPEQALEFILSPEREKLRISLLQTFLMMQLPRKPELLIQAMEHEALAAAREKFQLATMAVLLLKDRFSWPLVDENMPLPPDKRVRILTEAVHASSLPPSLKNNFLTNLPSNP